MSATEDTIRVDTYPAGDRERAWQEALARLSLTSRPSAVSPFRSGDLAVKPSSTGARLVRLGASAQKIVGLRAGADAPTMIVFHAAGRGQIFADRRELEFADGDLSVCDMAADWSMDLRGDFQLLALELPRARLLARLGHGRVRLPVVLGASVSAAAVRPVMNALAGRFDLLGDDELGGIEIAVTELVGAALAIESKSAGDETTQVQAAHFRRVCTAIEARLSAPDLSLADIAAQENLSQRYAQRLFEREGVTFSDYLRQRRLERCRADLVDPKYRDHGIAEICCRWGFRDQAHFSRTFSLAYGMSPRALRRTAAEAAPAYPYRGRPQARVAASAPTRAAAGAGVGAPAGAAPAPPAQDGIRHHLAVGRDTVHWGYLSRTIPPALFVEPGSLVTIETLTQHAFDDHDRMIKGDAGAEDVFHWTAQGKSVDRRGAGPMNASIFGRGAGEGFGVHICTGPVYVRGAEPGDVLEIEILDIRPRPSGNPDHAGRCFGSNAAAWWGYQYHDLIEPPRPREVITIYELDAKQAVARALYSYRWTPQTDPFGVCHEIMDYPGVPVDHATVEHRHGVLRDVVVPIRPHFGFIGVAPREADMVDSIPPGYFGGNVDNWRAGKGARIYLPVAVPGALLSVGDPHLAQGDGEINGTALECSLTGDFRLALHKRDSLAERPFLDGLTYPLVETPQAWVLHGFSYQNYLKELGRNAQSEIYRKSSVDLALRSAFRTTRKFLMDRYRLDEDEAVSLMSVAVDFSITQVADGNWGVHAVIRKEIFAGRA
ncbi:acetamidase/formamidase family protein [Polymorphum gilvum]|uniref:Transcriptional regulator, AraC family with acetamidase/formamidase activity n=1 Tax=Polymorphum gilvum (strain LMG 25793 / CGMCC 1.9160 / SL003B-26A1) TaxID=991905 RepID=F2J0T2_POLGS|nr:acetamidase/formamidase family protein [Polymorphum gilvum]ADZ70768.1 Transcriptional regulator, AraC family with acetamidase/formamidase activity [Polymorphum gilvum SL003B-26A1]